MNSNIIESNNETFTIGDYNGVSIIIRNKDNYINATEIAKDNNKQKNFDKYFKSDKWNEICEAFKNSLPRNENNEKITLFYILREGYSNKTHGTYVHPKLIHFVAEWCNISYAFKVAMIMDKINELKQSKNITNEETFKEKAEEEKTKLKEMIKIKDDKIDELTKKIDKVIEQNGKLYKKLDKQEFKIKILDNRIKMLYNKIDMLNEPFNEPLKETTEEDEQESGEYEEVDLNSYSD